MAWTAPRTWVAGEVVTADLMNTHVKNNLRYLKGLDNQVPTIESGLTIDNTDGDERLLLPLLTTAECTTVLNAEGEVAFDETTHQMKEYDGTAVRALISEADVDDTPVNGATTVPVSSNWAYDHLNLLTTAGDIPYSTAAGVWTRLGIGTANQLLRTNSGATAPEWATVTPATIVRKTADETVSNSTTLQNDDHLVLAVGVSEIWEIILCLRITTSAVANFKYAMICPVAAALYGGYAIGNTYEIDTPFAESEVAGTSIGFARTSAADQLLARFIYVGGANAGNIQIQWAQNTAEVSDTKVLINSYMICHKLA